MSRHQCQGLLALAAVVVALFTSRPADAQIVVDPGPPGQPMGLYNAFITGVWYDVKNQEVAEHQLQHAQAKLSQDSARGDAAAVEHDVRKIDNLKYRMAVNDWLIRKNTLQHIGYYPIRRVELSCEAIAQVARPADPIIFSGPIPPQGPMAAAPMVATPKFPITIANAEPAGAGIAFNISGVPYKAAGGSRQELTVAPDSYITYDGGGSLGQRRYRISPGHYEFRSTPEGWALYKLPVKP